MNFKGWRYKYQIMGKYEHGTISHQFVK